MISNNNIESEDKLNRRIIAINYKTAREYEENRDYEKAIHLYEVNVKKYNHALSKVKLAELLIKGKSPKIDNEYARKLLEEAEAQGENKGKILLGYMLANGLGGDKNLKKAYEIFKTEIENNNPDKMIYMELYKIIKKEKGNKKTYKSLKQTVTFLERLKYNRKVKIDKFNNTALGKFVNIAPNVVKTKLEIFSEVIDKEISSIELEKLYERAEKLYKKGKYADARRIYKRLANYNDTDSKLMYAEMCLNSKGGKPNLEIAKKYFYEYLDQRNEKLDNNYAKINLLSKRLKKIENDKDISVFKKSKIIKSINEEIDYYKYKNYKIYSNIKYKNALLNYGIAATEIPSNQSEFDDGINCLHDIIMYGEKMENAYIYLNEEDKENNRCSIKAVKRLCYLFDKGIWKPENLEEERRYLSKFSIGRASDEVAKTLSKMKFTSKDKVALPNLIRKKNLKPENIKKRKIPERRCKILRGIGEFTYLFGLNKISRSVFTRMLEKGDRSCADKLAYLEANGKGGKIDINLAKCHYRDYITRSTRKFEKEDFKNKFEAVYNLGKLYEKEEDYIQASELYLLAAFQENKSAKKNLRELNLQGKWNPKNKLEYSYIKLRGISKIVNRIENLSICKKSLNSEKKEKTKKTVWIKKKMLATATAGAIAISSISFSPAIVKSLKNDKWIQSNLSYMPNDKDIKLKDIESRDRKKEKLPRELEEFR